MSFTKLLVANRGEIALRVMRSARRLGYRTVAVFSEADAGAPHVAAADEALCLGPGPAAQSYLSIEALLAAARRSGADAVHPGYGFLSERADFAQACADAGLVFVGPPAAAIRAMGDKAQAKRRMIDAGVPCAPGYLGEQQDDATLQARAMELGFPLLVKAVAGGGGRGMRRVARAEELAAAIDDARREAASAFGDGTLMLERLIEPARHIEIQVFADAHGQVVHLGERDCSAQRRRQKLIEEAPSPVVDEALRERLGRDAVAAARAVGYVGAGTVEFVVDESLGHWFLEMNTRLQVEHPVTEAVTGFDLVAWQLRVAAGEPLSAWLPHGQADVRLQGHAIEVRLYAEDPYDGFRPHTGTVLHWQPEAVRAQGVRVDDGIAPGSVVSPFYDAMLAKLVVHGAHRDEALRRLAAALEDTPLFGLAGNARFLRDLLRDERFAAGRWHTTLIDELAASGDALLQRPEPDAAAWAVAAAAFAAPAGTEAEALRPAGLAARQFSLDCQGATQVLRVQHDGGSLRVQADTGEHRVRWLARDGAVARVEIDGLQRRVQALHRDGTLHLAWNGAVFAFTETPVAPRAKDARDPREARAPVAGLLTQLRVAVGDRVAAGQPLACVEAMKMEMWLHAGADGRVAALHVGLREAVAAGALVLTLDTEDPA